MTNFLRKKRAEWSDFSDELLEDSDDSVQTTCGWRNGNTVGKGSVSTGKRTLQNLNKNNFCLQQNELAEVQYRDSMSNVISYTDRNQLPTKRLSYLSKPSDCLNVSDSDMSIAINHGSSMATYRTLPNHRGTSYSKSVSHNIQARSNALYIDPSGQYMCKNNGFETSCSGNTLPRYNQLQSINGSKDSCNAITEKDVSRIIAAVKTKSLSPAKIQLLQEVLDSTAKGSSVTKKRHSKMMRPARASNLKRKRISYNAKSDSSDLSSTETDGSDNMISTMRPLHDNSNEMNSTRMTQFKLPLTRLHRKFKGRIKPLSTYDLRNCAVSNVTTESQIRDVGGSYSNHLSINDNSFRPNHRSTMLNIDCTNQSSMTNMSMRPSFMRRKLFTQSQEYIADGHENSFNERRAVPNIYANAEDGLTRKSFRGSVLPKYCKSRRSSKTDYFQTRRQTNMKQVNSMTPVLKHLIEKCNETGISNNHLPYIKKSYAADEVGVPTSIDRSSGHPLKKKLVVTSDSDQHTGDDTSDCNTKEKICKDRLMEPNIQQHQNNGSPIKNFANQKTRQKTDVIIPCYVHIRKEDIIRNTASLKKTSFGNGKDIECNNIPISVLSSSSDNESAKDDIGLVTNLSAFSEHHKSVYKSKTKSKNFENIDYIMTPLITEVSGTDKPLKKLTRLSLVKQDICLKNPTLSIETSDDEFILNKHRNKNKNVQSTKRISGKSASLNTSNELQNVSTGSSYFLRRKTVINQPDLNDKLTHEGKIIKNSEQRLTRSSVHKIDKILIKKNDNDGSLKVGKSDRIKTSTIAQTNGGCTLENVDTVKKNRISKHKQTKASKEISSTSEVCSPSDSAACRDTQQLNESCIESKSVSNDGSKRVAKKCIQNKFWNASSSSSGKEELNEEQNNLSDKQNNHNVLALEASIGHKAPFKSTQLVDYNATLGTVNIRHDIKSAVEQQLSSNVQQNYNTANLTQQFHQKPLTNIKESEVLPSFSNKVISEKVMNRNRCIKGVRNLVVPFSTEDFKNANVVNNKCNSVIEMNIKPRSGSRYGGLEGNKFLNEDDGCCSVISFNTVRSRRRKTRFVHFF